MDFIALQFILEMKSIHPIGKHPVALSEVSRLWPRSKVAPDVSAMGGEADWRGGPGGAAPAYLGFTFPGVGTLAGWKRKTKRT